MKRHPRLRKKVSFDDESDSDGSTLSRSSHISLKMGAAKKVSSDDQRQSPERRSSEPGGNRPIPLPTRSASAYIPYVQYTDDMNSIVDYGFIPRKAPVEASIVRDTKRNFSQPQVSSSKQHVFNVSRKDSGPHFAQSMPSTRSLPSSPLIQRSQIRRMNAVQDFEVSDPYDSNDYADDEGDYYRGQHFSPLDDVFTSPSQVSLDAYTNSTECQCIEMYSKHFALWEYIGNCIRAFCFLWPLAFVSGAHYRLAFTTCVLLVGSRGDCCINRRA